MGVGKREEKNKHRNIFWWTCGRITAFSDNSSVKHSRVNFSMNTFTGIHRLFSMDLVIVSESQEEPKSLPRSSRKLEAPAHPAAPPAPESSPALHPLPWPHKPRAQGGALDQTCSSPKARSAEREETTGEVFFLFCPGQGQKRTAWSVVITPWAGRGGEQWVVGCTVYPHCWQQHTHTGNWRPKETQAMGHNFRIRIKEQGPDLQWFL